HTFHYCFQLLPFTYCHALCTSDVFHSFVPHSFQTHFTTCACTALGRPDFFAGGKRWPAYAHCSCAPCSAQAPPAPPYACAGALGTHRFMFCREVHQDFFVS